MKMPKLSGSEVIKILEKFGFSVVRQKGSHIILTRFDKGRKKGVVVPNHKEIDIGTLAEIIRQAGLTKEEFIENYR